MTAPASQDASTTPHHHSPHQAYKPCHSPSPHTHRRHIPAAARTPPHPVPRSAKPATAPPDSRYPDRTHYARRHANTSSTPAPPHLRTHRVLAPERGPGARESIGARTPKASCPPVSASTPRRRDGDGRRAKGGRPQICRARTRSRGSCSQPCRPSRVPAAQRRLYHGH